LARFSKLFSRNRRDRDDRDGNRDDRLRGGEGRDTLSGGAGDDVIRGLDGDDRLIGGSGNDELFGQDGNDTLRGGSGDDEVSGGPGNDTAVLNLPTDGADTTNLGSGEDTVLVRTQEAGQIRLTFTSSEVGNGGARDSDTMLNQDGGLAVRLRAENDADGLTGPTSRFDDEGVTFVASKAGATFDVRDLVSGAQRGDQFKVVRLGTAGDDVLDEGGEGRSHYINAGMGNDFVIGSTVADFLVGGAGNDTLDGALGDDSFIGGSGNDSILGGAGSDRAIFNVSTDGADQVNLGDGSDTVSVAAGSAGQVRLTFTSSEVGNGSPNDSNTMPPNQDGGLAVRLQAEGGSDVLSGTVSRFDDEGTTFVAATPGVTFDVRDLVAGTQRGDQFEVVALGTSGGDNLTAPDAGRPSYFNAGMGNDAVTGGTAADFLVGGAGNDALNGGLGSDTHIGGAGADAFAFTTALGSSNIDKINDFSSVDDTVQLDNAVFVGLADGPLAAEAFAFSTDIAEDDDRIIYDQSTGNLFFDADGGSRDNSVAFATLVNRPADLNSTDFLVI
jgi:Ca2+-binding RTX toxin-like protein